MKLLRSWIGDFVDLAGVSNAELVELITTRIAEVDEATVVGSQIKNANIVKIVSAKKHPERSGLTICDLDNGTQVVCGAPNAREGLKTTWLPPGSKLSGFVVGERDFAGVMSKGLLLSESELEVGAGSGGIIELSQQVDSLEEYFGGEDLVIDIDNKSLTHRPDLWCHLGFARELAGILDRELKFDCSFPELEKSEEPCSVKILHPEDCSFFSAIVISGVKVEQSPVWIRRRLHSVGLGVKNNLVDLSNYVMLDIGQPNHLYDFEKVAEQELIVSRGGSLVGLDDEQYELSDKDISICDKSGVVGIGGIMGGKASSVTAETTKVILEAANFDAVKIRKTSASLGLRTDASNRFEKRLHPELTVLCLDRFCQLLSVICSQKIAVSEKSVAGTGENTVLEVELDRSWINYRLGTDLSETEIDRLLSSVGFDIDGSKVKVPSYRATGDVSIKEDLLEEIGRLNGYENVEPKAPQFTAEPLSADSLQLLESKLSAFLSGRGLNEVQLYSAVSAERQSALGYTSEAINLKNPVDSTASQLRLSLVPGMVDCLNENCKFESNFGAFELGRSYQKIGAACKEQRLLGLGVCTDVASTSPSVDSGHTFYFVSKICRELISLVTSTEVVVNANLSFAWQHPYRSSSLLVEGVEVAVVAEVHPEFSKNKLVVAELNLDVLNRIRVDRSFLPISKYPASFFEVSVVAPKRTYFSELAQLITDGCGTEKLKEVHFVSQFEGGAVKEGFKSVSLQLEFADHNSTVSREELDNIRATVVSCIENSQYEFRS